MAAIIGMCTDEELPGVLEAPGLLMGPTPVSRRLSGAREGPQGAPVDNLGPPVFFEPLSTQVLHYLTQASGGSPNPSLVSGDAFRATLMRQFGEETFWSAYQRTGRILVINVFTQAQGASTGEGKNLLLSYLSSPRCSSTAPCRRPAASPASWGPLRCWR